MFPEAWLPIAFSSTPKTTQNVFHPKAPRWLVQPQRTFTILEAFFTNTCDRPYGVAQAATGDPNLFPIVTCGARTFVYIPIHSKLKSHYHCRQQMWKNSSNKGNNLKNKFHKRLRTAWFPLGTQLAAGFLLCPLRWQLQLKLFFKVRISHMDSLMSTMAWVCRAHSSYRLSSDLKQHWEAWK